MPPYAAYALPAWDESIRVRASAKRISAMVPGIVQSGLFCIRTQAQKEKHPAISPMDAMRYQNRDFTVADSAQRLPHVRIRPVVRSGISKPVPPPGAFLEAALFGYPSPVVLHSPTPA